MGEVPTVEVYETRLTEKQIIFNVLSRHFSNPDMVYAIMGNIYGESNYNHLAVNPTSGAYGIWQWLGSRKDLLFETYPNPTLHDQLEYLTWELDCQDYEKKQFNKVKKRKGVKDLTIAFCTLSLRPSPLEIENSIVKRINEAKEIEAENI